MSLEARCLDCGLDYDDFPMDMLLPRSQWLEIHPEDGGLLCAHCIVKRAARLPGATGIHAIIEFVPLPTWADTDAPGRCERGHDERQPKCPACHEMRIAAYRAQTECPLDFWPEDP